MPLYSCSSLNTPLLMPLSVLCVYMYRCVQVQRLGALAGVRGFPGRGRRKNLSLFFLRERELSFFAFSSSSLSPLPLLFLSSLSPHTFWPRLLSRSNTASMMILQCCMGIPVHTYAHKFKINRQHSKGPRVVWCLKVYDIISGPDRWQGSGFPRPAEAKKIWVFFSPSKHTICVCIYIYIYTYVHMHTRVQTAKDYTMRV